MPAYNPGMKRIHLTWLLVVMIVGTAAVLWRSQGDARAQEEPEVAAAADPQPAEKGIDWATMPIEEVMARKRDRFLVFDEIGSRGKPSLWPIRMMELRRLTAGYLLEDNRQQELPPRHTVQALAELMQRQAKSAPLVCINIEHWELRGPEVTPEIRADSARKLGTLADWMHQAAPGMRIGIYRLLPDRDYYSSLRDNPDAVQRWKEHNDWLGEHLAPHMDVVFPSLYAFQDKPDEWKIYANANIAEAKQYRKQVYPFILPTFPPNANPRELGELEIDRKFWRLQMETCLRLADGMVVYRPGNNDWNPEDQWWLETLDFLAELYDEPDIRTFVAKRRAE